MKTVLVMILLVITLLAIACSKESEEEDRSFVLPDSTPDVSQDIFDVTIESCQFALSAFVPGVASETTAQWEAEFCPLVGDAGMSNYENGYLDKYGIKEDYGPAWFAGCSYTANELDKVDSEIGATRIPELSGMIELCFKASILRFP